MLLKSLIKDNRLNSSKQQTVKSMDLYLGGLVIGRIFASEIWGAYFRRAFFWGGGVGAAYYWNFTVLPFISITLLEIFLANLNGGGVFCFAKFSQIWRIC